MSEVEKADLGVVGLAVVGADLARNAARKGFGVALFNRRGEPPGALMRSHGSEGRFVPSKSLRDFVAPLKTPRIAIVTVAAGKSVDEMVDEIMPHLEPRDILVDAGNSLFTDSQRRVKTCEAKSVRFVGTGVSGGEEGALNGPGMMPGGDWPRKVRGTTTAQAYRRPCCAYIGPDGAGHYVKVLHNGIEYADIQLIAETYDILKSVYGFDASAISDVRARSILISSTSRPRFSVKSTQPASCSWTIFSTGRAEGDRPLDGPIRARGRRSDHRDHRGGLRPPALEPARIALDRGAFSASADVAAQGGARRDRRAPRRALRGQGHRLRAGI